MRDLVKSAKPGDRFTDPEGGTWAMLARGLLAHDGPYWSYVGPTGFWSQRTQKEAEAANLTPTVAARPAYSSAIAYLSDTGLELVGIDWHEEQMAKARHEAVSVPLDSRNPEHLRRVAGHVREAIANLPYSAQRDDAAQFIGEFLDGQADRIEREAAEKAQEATDRKRAEEVARGIDKGALWNISAPGDQQDLVKAVLAGIHAERQEVGQ